MPDEQEPRPDVETETEVIPAFSGEGVSRTQELPVVDDGVAPPAGPARPASPARPVGSSGSVATAPPAGSRRGRGALWAATAVALAALAVVAVLVLRERTGAPVPPTSGPETSPAATAEISARISSFDPSGGSGFRSEGQGQWRTQTYRSAEFGNLKSGVGLLLDLGAPRTVSSVTFDVATGPLAVELRAADERARSEAGFGKVAVAPSASGATTVKVDGGTKHRYWLIWVTKLAAQDGGFRAVIGDPAVSGPAG